MFLLILIVALLVASSTSYFKFHYVSINSRVHSNSLLRFHAALNSIMFLLILTGAVLDGYAVCDFKFHYVSINSGIAMRR